MGNVHKREMLGALKQSDKPEERRPSACVLECVTLITFYGIIPLRLRATICLSWCDHKNVISLQKL